MTNPLHATLIAGDAPLATALAEYLAGGLAGAGEAVLLARPEGDPAGDAALAARLGLPVWSRGYGAWESAAGAVAAARTAFGGLDALVHAPLAVSSGGILAAEPWQAEAALRGPLFQAYYLAAAAAPVLRKDGAILLTGDATGIFGAPEDAARAAAHAGLHGLMLALARELAPRGLRANLLLPLPGDAADGGAPEAAALVAAWLCTADADGPSGQVFLCRNNAVWLLGQAGNETRRIARLDRPWDISSLRQATRDAFSPYYFQAGVEANHLAQR